MLSEEFNLAPSQDDDRVLASLETVASPRKRRRWWLWLLVCCLIGVTAYALLYTSQAEPLEAWKGRIIQAAVAVYHWLPHPGHQETTQDGKAAETPGTSGQATAPPAGRAVPVVTTAATQGNMGIYLTGLGTVTAFNTVTVHTRVDGQLVKVAFQEG
jgi:multidrug efflux pump subunit AcrA (membrane-fusion protein)